MMMDYIPVVVQVLAEKDFFIYAFFSDGSIHKFDMKPLINRGGIFSRLKDEEFFRSRITVLNDTAAWDISGHYDPTNCIDIDPIVLYEESEVVEDPLKTTA